MKALSLTQPWASLVAWREKRIETRSWSTKFRGLVAIHAAKGFPRYAKEFAEELGLDPDTLPRGRVLAVANLANCRPTVAALQEIRGTPEERFGDYSPGRFAFVFSHVDALEESIAIAGALGLWNLPEEVDLAIRRRLHMVAG